MVSLITITQPHEHFNGIVHGRLVDINRCEPALKGGILFYVFVILVQCGGANTLQLPACQGRFEHVGCIHGTLCGTSADDGMQFIDHQDDLSRRSLDFFDS